MTNCESCPFNTGKKVEGEGSRIIRTYTIDVPTSNPKITFKREVEERDNIGPYDIVCVAMAPAREEQEQGRVLVGASGQILRQTLAGMGLDSYYLCNVFLCPITDDESVPQALKCCRDVIPEVLSRKPKLVIALGDLPLRVLTDNVEYTVTDLEGRIIPSKVGPLLVVKHPAYYWGNPNEFFDFLECTRSSVKFLNGVYEQAVEPTRTIVTSDNLADCLNTLDKYDYLGVDLETTGFSANGWEPDAIMEMGIAGTHDHAFIVDSRFVPAFKRLLEEKKGVYWNAQFDASFLKKIGISPNVDFDGMLAHYSIDERGNTHGLKRCAKRYLGCDDWEKRIDEFIPARSKKTVSYAVIPQDIRYEYLSKDVTRTLQMKKVLEEDMNEKVFKTLLMPACRMFIDIEDKGMRIDPQLMMDMEPVLQDELDRLDKEIRDITGQWINPNSPTQVAKLLYEDMGLPIDHFFDTATGNPSTGKAALEPYMNDPLVSAIVEYKQVSKMKGTYLEGFAKFVDKQFRIHPKINIWKAVTGRLSSEDPSIMNIKRDSKLKSVFLPDRLFGYGDIKGNELRWYVIISGDQELGNILRRVNTPENPHANDPHYWVGEAAYGPELADKMRPDAKAVVFGRIYKRSRKSIEYQVGKEKVEAVMKAVDSIAPNIDKYYQKIKAEIAEKGYVESYFGRKRRYPLITRDNAHNVEYQAVNFPIQSSGSDLMLLCMLHLWDLRKEWDIFPFWPVHDSITSDIPTKEIMPKMKKELEEFSNDITGNVVPFIWECDWGLDWTLRQEPKEGERVY